MKEILIPLNFSTTPTLYDSKQSFSASDDSSGVLVFTTTADVSGTVASLTIRNASENANRQTVLVERLDVNSSPFSYAVKMPLPFGAYEGELLLKKNLTTIASATFLFGVNSSLSAEVLPKLVEAYSLDALVESVETEVSVLKDAYTLTVSETVKGVNKTESTVQLSENVRYLNEATRKANELLRISQENARVTEEGNRVGAEALRETQEGDRQTTFEANEVIRDAVVAAAIETEMIAQNVATQLTEKEATFAPRILSVEQQLEQIEINMSTEGCVGDNLTDNSPIIQAVITSLTKNATLSFPDGLFKLNSNIDFMGKTINMKVSGKTEFTGAGLFPPSANNSWHTKNGNYLTSSPSLGKPSPGGETRYGDSVLSLEIVPEDGYDGHAVGVYASARGKTNTDGNIWGANFIVHAEPEYPGVVCGLEVDVDSYSSSSDPRSIATGIAVTGIGSVNADIGIVIERADTSKFAQALLINDAVDAIVINAPTGSGVQVFNAPNYGIYSTGAGVAGVHVSQAPKGFSANLITGDSVQINNAVNGLVVTAASGIGADIQQGGLRLGLGTKIKKYLRFVNTFTMGNIPAHSTAEFFWTPASAITGDDSISCEPVGDIGSGFMWSVRIVGAQVVLRVANITTAAKTPTDVPWIVDVWQH